MWRAVPLVAALWIAGCGNNIGDSCTTNIDCSPFGDRFCDTAEPGGYCTIEDCDVTTCPGNAVCIRFFTPIADEPCHPMKDNSTLGQADCTRIDERCVCDNSVNGECVSVDPTPGPNVGQPLGHCAPGASEHRWCQHACSHDSDCRSGYRCFETGTLGAEAIPSFEMGVAEPTKFCAPTGQTF